MAGRMTMERAKLILDFVVQWHGLNDPSRARSDIYDWVALKLSCHRSAAADQIDKAQRMVGLDPWNSAVAAARQPATKQPTTADPVRPQPPVTPLIDRLKLIERENRELVDFVAWLAGTGRLVNPGGWSHEEIVAGYRGIDLAAVALERKAVLQYAADMQEYWRLKDLADAARGQR